MGPLIVFFYRDLAEIFTKRGDLGKALGRFLVLARENAFNQIPAEKWACNLEGQKRKKKWRN
jgi:hypothetical protein